MGLPDKHDLRLFNHFAKFTGQGDLSAIVEVAVTEPAPTNTSEAIHIDITDLQPIAAEALTLSDEKLTALQGVKAIIRARLATAQTDARR